MDAEFLIFLENRVKLKVIHNFFSGKAHNQATILGPFDVSRFKQMLKQNAIVFLAHVVEIWQS